MPTGLVPHPLSCEITINREKRRGIGARLRLCPCSPAARLLHENLRTMAFGAVFLLVIAADVILPNKIISKMDVLGQSVARNI